MKVYFCKCKNISHPFPAIAWLIMIFQKMMPWKKDSYSHMAIEFGGNYYDASFDGCKVNTSDNFLKKYSVIERLELPDEITQVEFMDFFKHNENKKYDWLQIFGLLVKQLKLKEVNLRGKDFGELICSELLLLFMVEFYKIDICDSDNYDLVSTWKLAEKLEGKIC